MAESSMVSPKFSLGCARLMLIDSFKELAGTVPVKSAAECA